MLQNLIKFAKIFYKNAQLISGNENSGTIPILTLKNLLKHVPYNYHGYSGTLFGTLNLHDENSWAVNRNSGIVMHIMDFINLGKITGGIFVQINLTNNGQVRLTGFPQTLINQLHRIFSPIIQAAILKYKVGPSNDKDFDGLKIPPGGISFPWLHFNMPPPTTQPTTNTVQTSTTGTQIG